MKRKLFCVLCVILLLSQSISVFAADIVVGDTPVTGVTPSSFTAEEGMVGAGAVISLPATLDLEYNEKYDSFLNRSNVICSGSIAGSNSVVIECPETLEYTGDNSSQIAEAFIKFGNAGIASWSASEVSSSAAKELLVQVPGSSVPLADTFQATVNFQIKQAPVGMYGDIGDITPYSGLQRAYTTGEFSAFSLHYSSSTAMSGSMLNFNGLLLTGDPKIALIRNTNPSGYAVETLNNTTLKTIQMCGGSSVVGYTAYFDSSYGGQSYISSIISSNIRSDYLRNWLIGCKNVTTIVVPKNITKNSLHSYVHFVPGNSMAGTKGSLKVHQYDYRPYKLTDNGESVGDAIVFVKEITSSGKWIYVPNIVFQGTTDEWKALALGDDWVFGNAENLVTVHCTDGKLHY